MSTILNLSKFDGNLYKPTGKVSSRTVAQGEYYQILWATKKDGTNWTDYEEMENADIDDLTYYDNLTDIPDGKVCIGVLQEISLDKALISGSGNLDLYLII